MSTLTADLLALPQLFARRSAEKCPVTSVRPRSASDRIQTLPRDKATYLAQPMGHTVHCVSGSLWLTFDGDCRDVVLSAGAEHLCDRNTRLVAQALGEETRLWID